MLAEQLIKQDECCFDPEVFHHTDSLSQQTKHPILYLVANTSRCAGSTTAADTLVTIEAQKPSICPALLLNTVAELLPIFTCDLLAKEERCLFNITQ